MDPKDIPAFPTPSTTNRIEQGHLEVYAEKHYPIPGMTLRDYFAAKALAAIVQTREGKDGADYGRFATDAYGYADAMLSARGPA